MNEKIKKLDAENKILSAQIDSIEQANGNSMDLKKTFYANKLEMIRLYELKNKRNGITLSQLQSKVDLMPIVPKYDTGIHPFDQATGGIEQGTFIQFAGESGTGKTHFVTEVLMGVSKFKKAVFFSFEMGIRRSEQRLSKMAVDGNGGNLIIDFDTRNLDELCNEIILYANNDGIKFFAIDSKMKIEVSGKLDDYQKASEISARLAKIAQQNDIIVFLINQMNEQDIKTNRLAFKGSGDQKYDADISLFYVFDKDNKAQRRLLCTKNRTGDEQLFELVLKLNNNKTIDATVPNYPHQEIPYPSHNYDIPVVIAS